MEKMMNKKVVVIVPIKQNSTRVKNKNFKKINGVKLYDFFLRKLKKCHFDEIYVDTNSNEIKKYAIKNNFKVIDRLTWLSKNNANGNHLLNYHQSIIDAEYYFQLFITSPLMEIKTINECIKILKKNKKIDSILTVHKIYSWFWFKNKPVKYNPKMLPRSQDALPITQETTGLYGIRKKILKKYQCRIGKKPFFFEVNKKEALDLDTSEDFHNLNNFIKK